MPFLIVIVSMLYRTGQILVIASLSLLFLAYSNFAPTALGSEQIAGYVKNHFVREIIYAPSLIGTHQFKYQIQKQDVS